MAEAEKHRRGQDVDIRSINNAINQAFYSILIPIIHRMADPFWGNCFTDVLYNDDDITISSRGMGIPEGWGSEEYPFAMFKLSAGFDLYLTEEDYKYLMSNYSIEEIKNLVQAIYNTVGADQLNDGSIHQLYFDTPKYDRFIDGTKAPSQYSYFNQEKDFSSLIVNTQYNAIGPNKYFGVVWNSGQLDIIGLAEAIEALKPGHKPIKKR